jgi:D-serine deaminase-like pyridoxal phosphate-dependent protein
VADSNGLYPTIDTPAILVDLDKLEANIDSMAQRAADAGLKLRPHTKVHKSTYVSDLQIKAGAIGVSVSKLGEAVVYADAGQGDIMVVHPFYGDHKFAALKSLVERADISCVVDSVEGALGISQVGQAVDKKIPMLLKIDTVCRRFGALPGEPALKMARELTRMPGAELVGIITHECSSSEISPEGIARLAFECASSMSATASMFRKDGINIRDIVMGSTPAARALCRDAKYFPDVTEIHPGAYVFGDWVYMNGFSMLEDECAASIMVTVISRPSPDRACIDGGYKTFSADAMLFMAARAGEARPWSPTFGTVKGRPDIKVARLTEEIGVVTLTNPENGLNVGDRLEIIPNHISLAVNLHDKLYGVRNGKFEREIPVVCRGMDY